MSWRFSESLSMSPLYLHYNVLLLNHPDASINCRTKSRRGNTFTDAPRFVMEVLSPSTEKYDRTEKMELYAQQEIEEYWIVDWRTKTIEIYELDYDENDIPKYYLWKTISEENRSSKVILILGK